MQEGRGDPRGTPFQWKDGLDVSFLAFDENRNLATEVGPEKRKWMGKDLTEEDVWAMLE
jgi:hypothetical protein